MSKTKVTLGKGTRGPSIAKPAHAQYTVQGGGQLIQSGQKALAMRAKQVLKNVATAADPLT